jgi:predicted GNAT family acetyltransferase
MTTTAAVGTGTATTTVAAATTDSASPRTIGCVHEEQPQTTEPDVVTVADNPAKDRYEARLGDRIVGISVYRVIRGRVVFLHTEVDESMEGRGIGSRLASGALDDVRARGLRVSAKCPFIAAYLRRHREYDDLTA